MKKIMFNDRYGLTEAVLEKRKTMTRRIIPSIEINWARRGKVTLPVSGYRHRALWMDCRQFLPDSSPFDYVAPQKYQSAYDFDEEVAVAQSYKSIVEQDPDNDYGNYYVKQFRYTPGWANKMFVRADLMPHRIRITDIKVERLQDISEEDCLKEGLIAGEQEPRMFGFRLQKGTTLSFRAPRAAFAALIDKVSGRGTWERNPWVFVYEFELAK